jgi:acyl-CoA synthetase (AMP-forming)/AMP-acid ligase II
LDFITLIDKLEHIIVNGITIKTSGTSGVPKEIYQPPSKIVADAKCAIQVQDINVHSSIYTCLSLERAGGLFAQSIPGLIAGATVNFDKFNLYKYIKVADKYTHTHLTPKQAKGVMLTKGFKTLDLTGKTFLVGSEPVTYDIIEGFINRGARVICIWGMTEVGVNAIMHIFNNIEEVYALKDITPANSTVLGNIFNCDYKIDKENRLLVKGDISVYGDNWFNTQDQVIEQDGILFYIGRNGTPVDFNNPRKG